MGVPGSGDGRLELDDLGGVIDRASSLDEPAAETLEGVGGTSWAERLEDVGISPFVRRHRVPVAIVTAVVVAAGVGTTAYRATRPVPDDGVVAAVAIDTSPGSGLPTPVGGNLLQFGYTITPSRPHDTMTLLGLSGPGIRATSASSAVLGKPGTPVRGDVLVVPECGDPRLVTATWKDYRIRVQRVDAHGSTAIGLIDVPPASDAQWPQALGQACTQQWLDDGLRTESVSIAGAPARDELTVSVRLHNSLASQVAVDFTRFSAALQSDNGFGTVEAESSTTIPVTFRVIDCTDPRFEFGIPGPQGAPLRGLSLTANIQGLSTDGSILGAQQSVPLTTTDLDRIDAILHGICGGAPRTSARVLSAVRATNPGLAAGVEAMGNADVAVLRLRLLVSTVGRSITAGDTMGPAEILGGNHPSLTSGSSLVRGGAASVTLDWAFSCTSGVNPPTVAVAVAVGTTHHVYPTRTVLDDPVLARAVLRACPTLDAAGLADLQWTGLGPVPVSAASQGAAGSGGSGPGVPTAFTPPTP